MARAPIIWGPGDAATVLPSRLIISGLKGTVAGANAAAGDVGEYVESIVLSGSAITLTTATAANITSISLTAGDWDVTAVFSADGTITGTLFGVSISANSASETGTVLGSSRIQMPASWAPTAASESAMVVPSFRVNVSVTTTYYMVAKCTFTAGTLLGYGRLSARRVR